MKKVRLTQLAVGDKARISHCSPDCQFLRSMGISPNSQVKICSSRKTCIIVQMNGPQACCRIGLDRTLADQIFILTDS